MTDIKREWISGIKAGLPIALGYFPIGMAFGILAKGVSVTFFEALGFSFIVFAGASQFIAVSMIGLGASSVEIVLTTLFLNFRHFLMSASLGPRVDIKHPMIKPVISFFVTDETFSVASFTQGRLTSGYLLPMQVTAYLGWGIGTGVGYQLGNILPPLLQQSMGIGLYSMFVALLMPEIKKSPKALVLAIMAGILNTVLVNYLHLAQGWSIVIAIVVVSFLGVMIYDRDKVVADYE